MGQELELKAVPTLGTTYDGFRRPSAPPRLTSSDIDGFRRQLGKPVSFAVKRRLTVSHAS